MPREIIINGGWDGEVCCSSGRCEIRRSVNETWGFRAQPHEHMKAWACLLVSPTVTPVNS